MSNDLKMKTIITTIKENSMAEARPKLYMNVFIGGGTKWKLIPPPFISNL